VTIMLTGLALYSISFSYKQTGDMSRAMECAREALRIWQAALPPGHEDVVDAEKLVRDVEQALQERRAALVSYSRARIGRSQGQQTRSSGFK